MVFPVVMYGCESRIIKKAAAAAAKSLQLCLTLCDPRDGSPPGSPIPGILQARTLEWVAISFPSFPLKLEEVKVQYTVAVKPMLVISFITHLGLFI